MPNIIDSIQLSGSSYDVKDKSATTVVSLTQVEYDALPSSAKTDTSKMYIISDAEAGDLSQYWTSAQTNSAITQAVSGKVNTSSVVSSVTSASTDSEIPTAKAVWEAASGAGKTYTAGRGIDVTNEVISVSLPISAGTGTYSLIFNNASNKASGICAHAEGYITSANGYASHAEGSNTITQNQTEHASGQYNVSSSASTTFGDSGNTLFSVGNGTASNARHNAFEVRQNGDIYIQSGNTDIKLQDHLGGGGIDSGTVQTMIDKSISGKADSSSLATVATTGDYDDLTNKPTIPTVPTDVSAFNNDAGYATSGYVDSSVSGKLDTSVFETYSGSVDTALGNKQDTSGMTAYTQNTAFTAHTSDTTVHVTSSEKNTWNSKSDFSGSYNDLTDKPTIPTVPTDISAFNNDAGYTTSGYVDSAVSGKVNTSDFNTYSGSVETALSGKQDALSNANVLSGISSNDISNWNGKSDFSGSYDDLTNKPTIPSKTSDLTNDSNFATSGYVDAAVSGKANSSDVYTKSQTSGATELSTAFGNKLDTTTFNTYSASVQSIISDWVAEMIGVEYIQSTDGYQYINLGYVPSGSGIEIGGEIMIVSYPSTAQWMTTAYIAYTGEQYEAFRMIRRSNEDGTLYCNHHTKASGQGQAMSMTLGNKYTFKFTDSEYQFGADTYTNTGGTGTTNTTAIKLFGNGSAIGAITRIYSFYIKKDGALVMNLIPVVKNGVGMMYDKISGQFFGNNGTGSFTFPS